MYLVITTLFVVMTGDVIGLFLLFKHLILSLIMSFLQILLNVTIPCIFTFLKSHYNIQFIPQFW